MYFISFFFFSSRRRHTRLQGDWSSDVCSSDLKFVSPLASIRPFTWLKLRQCLAGRGLQNGQIVPNRAPHQVEADSVISVSESVPHTPDVCPGLAWHQYLRLIAEPIDSLANALQ